MQDQTPHKALVSKAARLSVAPMMDWTDRHCRYLHRLMTQHALLYTEMIAAAALVRGGARHLLAYGAAEHPVAMQLGGSDPAELAQAARICAGEGFDEVNLNIGCPSDRVQSGCFGAVLMLQPELVAECAAAMIAASPIEVTVKCRIGVDNQDPEAVLPDFLEKLASAGVRRFAIHARKAWLQGLSPKKNRDIPPLEYALVYAMKAQFPHLHLSINGGVASLAEAKNHLAAGIDGVMIGRAAYHSPCDVLLRVDAEIFGQSSRHSAEDIVTAMIPYIEAHLASGGRLHTITRHMLGMFNGRPGARAWRRILSEQSRATGAGPQVLTQALGALSNAGELVVG
ncbi:MAG: tRNA dihydrouridine(20/20a) synthase DusA [Paracoccaceae bacterium]